MDVAAAVVVVPHRRAVIAVAGDVEGRGVIGVDGDRIDVVVRLMLMIVGIAVGVSRHRGVGVGHARELKAVFDPVLRIDRAMGLQRDHDGHGEAGADLAEQSLQKQFP